VTRDAGAMNGLYALKPWYAARLRGLTELATARGWSPDAFTALGVGSAGLAALAISQGWLPLAALALAGRLAGANLDGAVARSRGVGRPWGFVLNELGDRAADVLMFAGLAALALRTGGAPDALWVAAAALAATLPTFASLAATAAGVRRANGGPLGKTERCALAVLATALPAWLPWIAGVIVVGSLATAGLRLRSAHRALESSRRSAS
jgi:CDP-diacylglycerol---glycerol-3-phosphate 3-phosphatidyltransferase